MDISGAYLTINNRSTIERSEVKYPHLALVFGNAYMRKPSTLVHPLYTS